MSERIPAAHIPKGKFKVKATSETLVKAWDNRKALYVSNPSTKEVWLALGPTAAKEEGIWLKKENGSGLVKITDYTGIVTCITTEGEGEIVFVEV
jgi:hypothetical protein